MRCADAQLFLKSVLLLMQDRKAVDSRDRVYSTLGLFKPEQQQTFDLTPDYSSSTTAVEVYTGAARAAILADRE